MILVTALRMVFRILTPTGRIRFCCLGVLTLISALIEAAGIASWIPFVSFAINPGLPAQNEWIQRLYRLGGFTDHRAFLISLGLGVLLLFLAGNTCRAVTVWLCYRFSWGENHRLSHRLLSRYLHRPYVWFLRRNSADLAKNVLEEVNNAVENVVQRLCMCMVRGFLALLICIGLLLLDPMVALTTAISLLASYTLFYRVFRNKLALIGELRLEANRLRYKSAMEAFSVVKEAKAAARVDEFVQIFRKHSLASTELRITSDLMGDLPGYLTEGLAVGGMLAVMIYFLATEGETSAALPMIALYIVAAIRLTPNLQNIYHDMVQIRFFLPSLEMIHQELSPDCPVALPRAARLTLKRSLSLSDMSYSYPGADSPALRNVSLEICPSTSTALAGRTGAGKTTLADIIAGALSPGNGSVLLDGEPLIGERLRGWQQSVGYVPQETFLLDDTIRNNIAFGVPHNHIEERAVTRAAVAAGIHEFIVRELKKGYDTVIGERGISLSGGQRQRIGIARALYTDPAVLVLDESVSSLDNQTACAVMEAIRDLSGKKTLVVIAHQLDTIKACDSICFLEKGNLEGKGTFEELMKNCPGFKDLVSEPLSKPSPR